jgi:hypothetical protein
MQQVTLRAGVEGEQDFAFAHVFGVLIDSFGKFGEREHSSDFSAKLLGDVRSQELDEPHFFEQTHIRSNQDTKKKAEEV